MAQRQSGRLLKITNDGLTRSCTGCFIAVRTHMATVGVKWLNIKLCLGTALVQYVIQPQHWLGNVITYR